MSELARERIHVRLDTLPKPYATESASKSPRIIPPPAGARLNAPAGFKITVYAYGLDSPRWLALTPNGKVLVTETSNNRIRLLDDADKDESVKPEEMSDFATKANGLNRPFGMAFSKDYFFLGNTNGVLRFPYKSGQGPLQGKGEKLIDLPTGGHWTRNVAVSPDQQWLYVAVGSQSNVEPEVPPRAAVLRMRPDGSEQIIFASGMRNPTGLAFHPVTGMLYALVQERDALGDDLVPDYLTQVRDDGFYGWPYAYLAPANLDPRRLDGDQSERPDLAAKTITPDVLFAAHSSAMAIAFTSGKQFPAHYRNGAFVTLRGSWNRNNGTGYKVVFVPFNAGRPEGYYENFVTGFLTNAAVPEAWGRPVGALFLPDGSLIFTDEENGRIYRVSYDA